MAKKKGADGAKTKMGAGRIVALIALILVLAVIGVAIYFWMRYTNGGTEEFKSFIIEIDGTEIHTEKTTAYFTSGTHEIKAKYLFSALTGDDYDYNVKFVPKEDIKFDYSVNGNSYLWTDIKEEELTPAFSLSKTDGVYTFTVPETLDAVLKAAFPGQAVSCPSKKELPEDGYIYELIVSSYNEKIVYTIDFCVVPAVEGIETPGGIYF